MAFLAKPMIIFYIVYYIKQPKKGSFWVKIYSILYQNLELKPCIRGYPRRRKRMLRMAKSMAAKTKKGRAGR